MRSHVHETEIAKMVGHLQFCLDELSNSFIESCDCIIKRGFEQEEVTCNPNTKDPNALWNVEENLFPRREFH